jgi:flagellar assembly protein FliH
MSSLPLDLFGESGAFLPDPRFGALAMPPPPPLPPADPQALAWDEGYAAGFAQAQHEAQTAAASRASERTRIELSLARLDGELAEALRTRLFTAIEVLCEVAIAPLALDRDALAARVERAAAMLARADDDKVLRLHPDDCALLAGRLPDGLALEPDPALERGALRLETANGGVEDGPAQWRRAIAEAIASC